MQISINKVIQNFFPFFRRTFSSLLCTLSHPFLLALDKKRRELSEQEHNEIISAWKCGVLIPTIINTLKFEKPTVYRVINTYKKTGEKKTTSMTK